MAGFPRSSAAASLKHGSRQRALEGVGRFSAVIGRGLIEAAPFIAACQRADHGFPRSSAAASLKRGGGETGAAG